MVFLSVFLLSSCFWMNVFARPPSQHTLANDALEEILLRGMPIMGDDIGCSRRSKTCDWMARVPDNVPIASLSIPGTHDTATWNYSEATREEFIRYTGPNIPPAEFYRCQQKSLFDQLNDGIRAFDLRVAYNPGNDTLGFWHSVALLAPTTTLQDALFGMYSWLLHHPTETVLVSINIEGGHHRDEKLEHLLVNTLTNDVAKKFWARIDNGELGNLGSSRGKLVLLQRFDLRHLSQDLLNFGIHLSASKWTDNSPDLKLVYWDDPERAAYIEDMYEPLVPTNAGPEANIANKIDVTTAHITNASQNSSQNLFITFASANKIIDPEPVTPLTMALGPSDSGVNQRLLSWLTETSGLRKTGVVMLDFYDVPPNLVETIIGI